MTTSLMLTAGIFILGVALFVVVLEEFEHHRRRRMRKRRGQTRVELYDQAWTLDRERAPLTTRDERILEELRAHGAHTQASLSLVVDGNQKASGAFRERLKSLEERGLVERDELKWYRAA